MILTRKYDAIFNRYRGPLPLNFVRALAYKESRLNHEKTGGSYWGILQVGWRSSGPLAGYNKRNGTNYGKYDLLEADIGAKVGIQTIQRIVASYARNHSGKYERNMSPDWSNIEFVKLVIAGWNSGYSEAGGVGRVARWLRKNRIVVTHDSVFEYARAAGGTQYLQIQMDHASRKKKWQAAGARLFYREGGPGLLDAGGMGLRGVEPYLPYAVGTMLLAGALGLAQGTGALVGALGAGAVGSWALTRGGSNGNEEPTS